MADQEGRSEPFGISESERDVHEYVAIIGAA
jgi:hypothetical protein